MSSEASSPEMVQVPGVEANQGNPGERQGRTREEVVVEDASSEGGDAGNVLPVPVPNVPDEDPEDDEDPRVGFQLPNLSTMDLEDDMPSPIPTYPPERRLSRQLDIAGSICATPARRSNRAFVNQARRQSAHFAVPGGELEDPDDSTELSVEPVIPTVQETETDRHGLPIIDGRALTLRSRAPPLSCFAPVRLWNKENRENLSGEARAAFIKEATGYVLPKHNKLCVYSLSFKDEEVLSHVQDHQAKVRALEDHMRSCDILDVNTVVIPRDLKHTSVIERRTYSCLREYSHLHAAHLANSNAWYNVWVTDKSTRENLMLVFHLLKNNTDPELWAICMEAYSQFTPVQQGGPLMLYLILTRIRDSSEQALVFLQTKVANLVIRNLEGENVEKAVSLIKNCHGVLQDASTPSRPYVPRDFVKTVLSVLVTTSVPEFNDGLIHLQQRLYAEADMKGVAVVWPSLNSVCRFALAMYRRLKASGEWDAVVGGRSRAYMGQPRLPPSPSTPFGPKPKLICWNCGEEGHGVSDCKKPKNQSRIDSQRNKFFKGRDRKGFRSPKGRNFKPKPQGPKRRTGPDGRPQIRNKNGAYVLDQKAARQIRDDNIRRDLGAEGAKLPARGAQPQGNVAVQAEAVRVALRANVDL